MKIRDRIKELRRVPTSELQSNPKNWRLHPKIQQEALKGLLAEVGYADALLARETPDGKLMLIDGHLRAETTPDSLVPVLILDVDESEADKLLATLDPLAALAETDSGKLKELMREVETANVELQLMLERLVDASLDHDDSSDPSRNPPLERMELQPYEHYDYVLVLARTTHEWHMLCEKLEIERVDSGVTETGTLKKVGVGRCISATRVLERLK